jgi:LmbE family N-acetylglucosaminyl deacetylase
VDLTAGELGTRGNASIRAEEAAKATSIMGISFRKNLELRDGFFDLSESNKLAIIRTVREHRPEIVITNAIRDRHPDHGRGAQLVSESCFLSGLSKIGVNVGGEPLEAWRPRQVYHMIQDYYLPPDICVDITPYIDKKQRLLWLSNLNSMILCRMSLILRFQVAIFRIFKSRAREMED